MLDRRFLLTCCVVGALFILGWGVARTLPDPDARVAVYLCAGLFSLAIVRSVLWRPIAVLRRWSAFADHHGYEAKAGLQNEPRLLGERHGVRFLMAQSTQLLGGSGGYYARTAITAAIEEGVPDGLRLYRRDSLEWMHQLSGLRSVWLDDFELDDAFMIEGSDEQVTADWVRRHRTALLELAHKFPGFILYGSEIDGLPVAAGGASGALTVVVVGRKSKHDELENLVEGVTSHAAALSAQPAG